MTGFVLAEGTHPTLFGSRYGSYLYDYRGEAVLRLSPVNQHPNGCWACSELIFSSREAFRRPHAAVRI